LTKFLRTDLMAQGYVWNSICRYDYKISWTSM